MKTPPPSWLDAVLALLALLSVFALGALAGAVVMSSRDLVGGITGTFILTVTMLAFPSVARMVSRGTPW